MKLSCSVPSERTSLVKFADVRIPSEFACGNSCGRGEEKASTVLKAPSDYVCKLLQDKDCLSCPHLSSCPNKRKVSVTALADSFMPTAAAPQVQGPWASVDLTGSDQPRVRPFTCKELLLHKRGKPPVDLITNNL